GGARQQVLDRIPAEKERRGEAQTESRFDAGVRDSHTASGTSDSDRDAKTPLPSPLPGLAREQGDFAREDATRVMQPDQAEALLERTRESAQITTPSYTPPVIE